MTMVTIMASWLLAGVSLMFVYVYRGTRYIRMLVEAFPDSDYARLGQNGEFVAPWELNRQRTALVRTMADQMPPAVAQARAEMIDVWRSFVVVAFGGIALLGAVALSGIQNTPYDAIVRIVLVVMLAALMVITAMTIARAIRVPWPTRWLFLLGAVLGTIGTVQLAVYIAS